MYSALIRVDVHVGTSRPVSLCNRLLEADTLAEVVAGIDASFPLRHVTDYGSPNLGRAPQPVRLLVQQHNGGGMDLRSSIGGESFEDGRNAGVRLDVYLRKIDVGVSDAMWAELIAALRAYGVEPGSIVATHPPSAPNWYGGNRTKEDPGAITWGNALQIPPSYTVTKLDRSEPMAPPTFHLDADGDWPPLQAVYTRHTGWIVRRRDREHGASDYWPTPYVEQLARVALAAEYLQLEAA